MVSISSPYSEESDGLGHERSRMAEAAASGATSNFVVFGYFVVEYLFFNPVRDQNPRIPDGKLSRSATGAVADPASRIKRV